MNKISLVLLVILCQLKQIVSQSVKQQICDQRIIRQLDEQKVPYICLEATGELIVQNLDSVTLSIDLDGGEFPSFPALNLQNNQNVTLSARGTNIEGIFIVIQIAQNVHILDFFASQIGTSHPLFILQGCQHVEIDTLKINGEDDRQNIVTVLFQGSDTIKINNAEFDQYNAFISIRTNEQVAIKSLTINSSIGFKLSGKQGCEIEEIVMKESQSKLLNQKFATFFVDSFSTLSIQKIRIVQKFENILAYTFQIYDISQEVIIHQIEFSNLKGVFQKGGQVTLSQRRQFILSFNTVNVVIEKVIQENNQNNFLQISITSVQIFQLNYYSISNSISTSESIQSSLINAQSGNNQLQLDQIFIDFITLQSLSYTFFTSYQTNTIKISRLMFPSNPRLELNAVKAHLSLFNVQYSNTVTIDNSYFIMNGLPLDLGSFQSNEQFTLMLTQSTFSHINARLSNGGCLSLRDQYPQLYLKDVLFRGCISYYFAGAIYGGQLIDVQNVTQQNCSSMIAGGSFFSKQTDLALQKQINYVNNHAQFQADYLQLDQLQMDSIFEYNPQFIGKDIYLKSTNYKSPEEFVSLRMGFSYVIFFKISNKTNTDSDSASYIEQPLNLFQFSQPSNSPNINLIEGDIQNFKGSPYLIFFMNTQQGSVTQNSLILNFIDYQYIVKFNFTINSQCDQGMEPYQFFGQEVCKYCDYTTISYSNSLSCQACNENLMDLCYANYSSVQKGNWRSVLGANSSDVYPCDIQPLNCLGGNMTGNYLCKEGTIGPQCLSCDIRSSFWSESFGTESNFGCLRCNDVEANTTKVIISVITFFIISIFLIYSQYRSSINILYANYLSKMGMIYIGSSLERSRSTTPLTKILLFGLSIYEITSFVSQFSVINNISILFGYPINSSFISADCFLVQVLPAESSVGFGKLVLSVVVPCVSLILVLIILMICLFAKKIRLNRSLDIFIMAFGYLFLFTFYQTILQFSLESLSCIQLQEDKSYLLIDLAYECDSDSSQIQRFKAFAIPFLIILSLLSPIAFFYYVFQTRNQHHRVQVKFKVGFVYQEYKIKYYYWEVIRQVIRIFMVMIKIFFIQSIISTIALYSICLIIYLSLIVECRPFTYKQFNQLEITLVILSLSHILASLMYKYALENTDQGSNQTISKVIFYITQIILLLFFAYLIILIISSFFVNTLTNLSRSRYAIFKWFKKYFPQYNHQLFLNYQTLRKLTLQINLKETFNNKNMNENSPLLSLSSSADGEHAAKPVTMSHQIQ